MSKSHIYQKKIRVRCFEISYIARGCYFSGFLLTSCDISSMIRYKLEPTPSMSDWQMMLFWIFWDKYRKIYIAVNKSPKHRQNFNCALVVYSRIIAMCPYQRYRRYFLSNGRNYGQCNEITVHGEHYICELQLTYASDPIWIKGNEERNEDGARGQCHLKSYQGQGH